MLKKFLMRTHVLQNQIERAFAASKAKVAKPPKKPKQKVKKMQLPPTTMNECPVPEGDWNQNFAKISSSYNKIFFSGTLAFFGSAAFIIANPPFVTNYQIPDIDL